MTEILSFIIICLACSTTIIAIAFYTGRKKALRTENDYKNCMSENEQLVDEIDRMKEELQLIRLKAGESDRLKSAFLLNMSHELRTPLHAIMGFAGLISNPAMPEENKVTYANIINRNVDSLLEIINDIFDISQFESGETEVENEPVNVNNLLNAIQTWVNLEKINVEKEDIVVRLNKANKDNSFSFNSDEYKLKRALSHLASNALKYSTEGYVEIGYTFSGINTINFYVKDEGIGLSKEDLEFIFNDFRQVDESATRQYGGLGLGLTIAQKFVSILEGKLWAESEPGRGSTFWISLPMKS